jgi:O-antigen ligase
MLRTRDDLRTFFIPSAVAAVIFSIGQIVSFAWVAAHHHLLLGDAPAFLNSSPNADALYLEPLLAFAVAFVAFPWSYRTRLVAGIVAAFVFVAMILTLSRAGYLAMTVLALVVVLRGVAPRWRYWVLAGLAVIAVIVLEVPFINQRVITIGASAGLRTSIYGQALRMLAQRPILGAGIDGFATRVAPFRPGTQEVEIYPHDIWLTTWSEVGLLGLVVFAVLVFLLLWRGVRALPYTNEDFKPVLWGAVGALILFVVHGLFDSPYWKNDLAVEFWMIAALEAVAIRGALGPARRAQGPAAPQRL